MAVDVPVILLNWNGIDDTIECVDSLRAQVDSHPIIYIGDNASDNQEGQALYDRYATDKDVHVYLFDENHGFAKGCNILMKEAMQKYPYCESIALLNNDAVADPHWLSYLLDEIKVDNVGMVGSKLISYHNRNVLDNVGHRMLTSGEIVPIGNKESVEDYDSQSVNFGSCAAGVLYSREMLEKIGLFDPYFHTGYEDAELGARALVSGYTSVYNPDAIVYHKVSQSVSKIFDQSYVKIIQRSIHYTYFKVIPTPLLLWTMPGIIMKLIAMTCLNTVTGKWHRNNIHWSAIRSVWNDRKLIRQKRREFLQSVTPISSFEIRKMQDNWVSFDSKRFWKFHVKGEKSQFEKAN